MIVHFGLLPTTQQSSKSQQEGWILGTMLRPTPDGDWILSSSLVIIRRSVVVTQECDASKVSQERYNPRSMHCYGNYTQPMLVIPVDKMRREVSGFRANREHEVYTFDFLKKNEYNYGTVMQQEEIKSENWLRLTSLQGIKSGQGNGLFKTYGEENVK